MAEVSHAMSGRVLITGATGYVGGRLVRRLAGRGHSLRVMARDSARLQGRFPEEVEICEADVTDSDSLVAALRGVDFAFYLIHSMGYSEDFESRDRDAARNFAKAAAEAGVRRIVYLGGLGSSTSELSPHLRSRHEVGEILRTSGVEVIEFRASIVIGSGSLSFEIVRALAERLPVMITPRWVEVRAQPIAIGDLLEYLAQALDLPPGASRIFEIGGSDRVTYGDLIREYSRQRGLRRLILPVPLLTPRLSSLWLGLVTPVYARVGRALVDSIRHPTIVEDTSARKVFPIDPIGAAKAIELALRNDDREFAETQWSDAISSAAISAPNWGGVRLGNRLIDSRTVDVAADPDAAFAPIRRIGGVQGWYFSDWLWRLRGFLDLLVGGVGLRRGRRDPEKLLVGDSVDFWRVEVSEPNRLRLRAEMKLPGRAWLEFEVTPIEGGSRIRQTAEFDPLGVAGLLYWYGIFPLHQLVFAGMLRGLAAEATGGKRSPSGLAQVVALGGFLLAVFTAAAIGGLATSTSVGSWYQEIRKPLWNPPGWIFGPVWTFLYVSMALAVWLAWRARPKSERPLIAFWVQLALNALWSIVFFGLRSPGWALVVIALLWPAIWVARKFLAEVSPAAGWLLLPYLLWVGFAAVLNFTIWWLN